MARELNIRITADDTDAKAKLGQTEQQIEGVTKTTERETKKQEDAYRKLGAAIGAAFSLQQLAAQAAKVTSLTSRIDDLAKTLQMSTDEVQELSFAAKMNGDNIASLDGILANVAKRVVGGDESFVAALQKAGLGLDDLRGKAPIDVLTTLATAVSKVPDPLERSAMATALFGRSASEHLPLLTSNIADLRQQARDLGLVIKSDLIAQGDQLGDTWDAQKLKVDALRTQAMLPLLNIFVSLPPWIQTVIAVAQEFSGVIGGIATSLLLVVGPKGMLTAFVSGLSTLGTWLGTAASSIGTFVAAIGAIPLAFVAAGAALIFWKDDILRDLGRFFELVPRFVGDMKDKVVAFFASMALTSIEWAQKLYTGVKSWLVDKFMGIVDGVKGGLDKVSGFFKDLYMKVVGGSYVPDTVIEIGQWMRRLDGEMVAPAEAATRRTRDLFAQMLEDISGTFDRWGMGLAGWITGKLSGLLGDGLSAVASGLLTSFGNLLTGGIAGLVQKGAQLAWEGLKKLGGAIASAFGRNATKGSREDFATGMGFDSLGALYTRLQSMGPEGANLAHLGLNVIGKNDTQANELWKQEVSRFLNASGFSLFDQMFGRFLGGGTAAPAPGVGGPGGLTGMPIESVGPRTVVQVSPIFNVNAMDAKSFGEWLRSGAAQEVIDVVKGPIVVELDRMGVAG